MPPADPGDSARPELAHEQDHLTESRAALARMRERTASMEALSGDRVSAEYLKFTLWKRMKALEDDPDIPLFFGRLDYGHQVEDSAGLPGERFYIGRRHVTDQEGDPLVVDWRAPISRPFYRASRTEPMGLRLRRRFGFQHGVVTAYEDETLTGPSLTEVPEDTAAAVHSEILEAEIERPRVGPMRDIVATIQPEQDDIVRSELDTSVCVQGAPGHRQDRGRAAPRGLPALCPPRPAEPAGGARRRAERLVPALHRRRAAGPRRDRCEADHGRGAGRRACRSGRSTRSRRRGSRAMRGWRSSSNAPCGAWSGRRPRPWSCRRECAGGGLPLTWSTRSSRSSGPAASGTAPGGPCCRSGSRTRCSSRWRRPATRPTTGSMPRSRGRDR